MTAMITTDCVLTMLEELRTQRPAVYLADEFAAWEASVGQVISSLPGQAQRWAATVLVANDLCVAMPGLPLSVAFLRVQTALYGAPLERL
jgi:hypothetical protein